MTQAGTNIIFDTLGAQVQVQYETGNRLTTWTSALEKAGYTIHYTDYTKPLAPQVDNEFAPVHKRNKVFIITTHQRSDTPNLLPAIAPCTSFGYTSADLGGIQTWIHERGGGLLLFVNHGQPLGGPPGAGPYWPINDIQLAAALGITTVFASIPLSTPMTPSPDAPPAIIDGVKTVEALDSGGIVPAMSNGSGTVLVPLSASTDMSGLGYSTESLAFAVLYKFGKGKVIVIGHSGIAGNTGTDWPSPGQIGAGDNLKFLMNCVNYLADGDS